MHIKGPPGLSAQRFWPTKAPPVTQEFIPVYFVDACGYVDIKIEAIETHWDQHKKPYI